MKCLDNAPECHILFEDNHLIAVYKPAALLTQPSPTEEHSLETLVKQWIKKSYQKPGNVYLHAIHRLDRDVDGIVLFARTSKALSRLQKQMREQKIERVYQARIDGEMEPASGLLENTLIHASHHAEVVHPNHPDGKTARLEYETIEWKNNTSLLLIRLITGRYHQIRVQLAHVHHPVIGDCKYGGRRDSKMHLTHVKMIFQHPVTLETIEINSSQE
jgi:23S rRNA pseudouridine1911/1915/1917 synthase